MKTVKLLLALFLMMFVHASADSCVLSFETISNQTILQEAKYEKLRDFDRGHHKTIIKISELPEAKSYIVKWKRSLFSDKEQREEWSKELFTTISKFLELDTPALFMSSRWFLPGEKVIFSLETIEGTPIGPPLELILHPVIQESKDGKSKLIVKLPSVSSPFSPTKYEITFEGILLPETMSLISTSSGEKLSGEFQYKLGSCIAYGPGVAH